MIVNDYGQLLDQLLEDLEWMLANDEKQKKWAKNINHDRRRTGRINSWHIAKTLIFFDFRCAYCGCEIDESHNQPHSASIDHVIPITKGGMNIPQNIVISCYRCNNAKHEEYYQEWLEQTFGEQAARRIWQKIDGYFVWLQTSSDYGTMLEIQSIESQSGLQPAKIAARFDF